MASTAPVRHARKALLWLGIIHLVLFAVLTTGVVLSNTKVIGENAASFEPKLALDLQGGTEMILAPQLEDPNATIDADQLAQAVAIIRERVSGSGVNEAQVSTQNGRNIVVAMPGEITTEQRDLIKSSAQMEFRAVLMASSTFTAVPEESRTKDADLPKPTAKGDPNNGSDTNWITAEWVKKFEAWDCLTEMSKTPRTQFAADGPAIACEIDPEAGQAVKYLLGPVEVKGADISSASSGQVTNSQGYNTGAWGVNLSFNSEGTEDFKKVTQRLTGLESPRNQFAIVLDGSVVSAPRADVGITDGNSQITGNFTQQSAAQLAQQLKYGALPMSFTIQSDQQISPTLGTDQLKMGLIAGLIGLILVAIYSFFQYRLLGLVTIASLLIAGLLTYLAIALLGWSADYRLSLAGVAGIIVAIGLTADSFIVYFERIRDELRDGRSLTLAVENGWSRAKRTIMASKAVNLLAAVVLYFVSVGNVKGFAFTLGLTAVADLVVVFLFTHPVLQILAKTRFFGEGHKLSGLDPSLLGAQPLYRGAGTFRERKDLTEVKAKDRGAAKEAQRRMTIAERKRAEELERRSGGTATAVKDEIEEETRG
ncbi:protein translocase subunit SecD [Galactobacter valiniphilus]|uniref:Protein translocase subunit SecD n=1 Tax=Galactobacter valiniphilus TaxID=2676122 RepID=A0A399JG53_9MICC|nr:protein translocase subunit SecD [Galactobacter valiniphilus]RII43112.1 protein translocase subunit SecD [Galactobacter valiniphilus]